MSTRDTSIKHYEIKAYELHGVRVLVEIDYDEGLIALLEGNKENGEWRPKKWIFAGRTIDYMQGWKNILDAMYYAIDQATESLQKHQDKKDRELKQKEARLYKAIAAHKDKEV